jgi:hypothetical protein
MQSKCPYHSFAVAILLASVLTSCRTWVGSVDLPAGYVHEGVRTVYVQPGDADDYFDKLATETMKNELDSYTRLFRVVPSVDDAEMIMTVCAEERMAASRGRVSLFGASSQQVPSTYLQIMISTAADGQIYENSTVIGRHPNRGLEPAAKLLMVEYTKGR